MRQGVQGRQGGAQVHELHKAQGREIPGIVPEYPRIGLTLELVIDFLQQLSH